MLCPGHWEEEKWYYLGHENAGRFMRALGWVQFLADCASVVALFLLLGDQDPTQYRKMRQAPPLSPVNSSYQNDMSLWHQVRSQSGTCSRQTRSSSPRRR